MKKRKSLISYQRTKLWLLTTSLTLLSTAASAEELTALKGATDWIVNTLITVAVTVLGLQIMYRLWQVNQGHKEWNEVAKPILITALIVSVPTIGAALSGVMK